MTRIEWIAFPQQRPSRLETLLIITYDSNNRPMLALAWYDSDLRRWSTDAGTLRKPVSHYAFLPDLPADTLTPAQVRELEATL